MDVSRIGGHNPLVLSNIRIDKSAVKHLIETKHNKVFFGKEPITDNFLNSNETNPVVEVSFNEGTKAALKSSESKAVGAAKTDLEMRGYWHEYNEIFSGGSPNGWRSLDMETMYSQAAEIYKQIENSSASGETKALKRQALENALKTGTGMYAMNKVGEKLRMDALEAEAQGKTIDRTDRSKFDKLSKVTGVLQDITSVFLTNLKNGQIEGSNYGDMISEAVSKMMSYRYYV